MRCDTGEETIMKIMRIVLLTMLIQPVLAPGPLGAQQGMNNQRGARNSDEWLKKEVRHELLTLPWYSVFDNLAYSVNNGEVNLYGQVVQPTLKSDAENAVKHIEGVEKVDEHDWVELTPECLYQTMTPHSIRNSRLHIPLLPKPFSTLRSPISK